MEIKNESFATQALAKKMLKEKAKEKELVYEQKNALDFLEKFCKLGLKEAEELAEELRTALPRLNEKHIAMLADFMPATDDEVKLLFSNEVITLAPDDRTKILAVLKKHT
ncbi:MAG: hypothetical protein HY519_00545 [Candidatus Aenigmarchaeota archaeon]|nr:hypothetical protein [Candidatus Aenigmarchaeota archaeon]